MEIPIRPAANMPPLYDPEAVRPMEEELEFVGVTPAKSAEAVDAAIARPGTTLVVVNSVCGCAAGGCRPGVAFSLQHGTIPDNMITVFAGVDRAAVERARQHMSEVPPSSPAVALFKDGKPVHILERRHIERMDASMVAENLRHAYDEYCKATGPSIPADKFQEYQNVSQCGSSIPRFGG